MGESAYRRTRVKLIKTRASARVFINLTSVPRCALPTMLYSLSYTENDISNLILGVITLQKLIIMSLRCYFSKTKELKDARLSFHCRRRKSANILGCTHILQQNGCQHRIKQVRFHVVQKFCNIPCRRFHSTGFVISGFVLQNQVKCLIRMLVICHYDVTRANRNPGMHG